jgi:hypothetical protein
VSSTHGVATQALNIPVRSFGNNTPDWSLEHFSPVEVSINDDPRLTLCKLNFKVYSEGGPHNTPMFKDLVSKSSCRSSQRHMTVSELQQEVSRAVGTPAGRVLYPTAFVFHESRVGSTLVANILGSDPFNMVFSESAPPAHVLLHCNGCTREKQIRVLPSLLLFIPDLWCRCFEMWF